MFHHFGTGPTEDIEYRSLTEDRVEDALVVQQKSMLHESIALGVGMFDEPGAAEEMQLVFREVIKEGCSIVAIDIRTEEVVAVAFNKLHVPLANGEKNPLETFVENNIKHKSCLDLINFLTDVESRVDLFDKYNVVAAMEIFYVGTDSRYRGYRIGQRIIEASLELARRLLAGKCAKIRIGTEIVLEETIPEIVFGVFTSNFSQKVAERLNFDLLVTVYYDDCLYHDEKMSKKIGNVHKTAKLGVLKL